MTNGPVKQRRRPRPKLFRDPVHDVITFEPRDPAEALALRLVDSREMQRLRRIRQLGLASLVFHGAEHSRFAHSLGVFHVARRMLGVLGRDVDVTWDERCVVLCSALLHDVGHGPFSHTAERAFDFVHEKWSEAIVLGEGEVNAILAEVDPTLPRAIAEFIAHRPGVGAHLAAIVSSQLDADRLDYILRDGAATGVGYSYDLHRIVESLELDPEHPRLLLTYRGHDAAEGYLLARHHMYRNLYFHKTARAAAAMLFATLRRARQLAERGSLPTEGLTQPFVALLTGEPVSEQAYLDVDDGDVWRALKVWRSADDPVLPRLAAGLLDRRLYKTIDLTGLDADERDRLREQAVALLAKTGHDPEYSLLVDEARDLPYQPYRAPEPVSARNDTTSGTADAIFVRLPDGSVREFSETSATVRALASPDVAVRWCVPEDVRPALTKLLETGSSR